MNFLSSKLIVLMVLVTIAPLTSRAALIGSGTVDGLLQANDPCQDIDSYGADVVSLDTIGDLSCTLGQSSALEWGLKFPRKYRYIGNDVSIEDRDYTWTEISALASIDEIGFVPVKSQNSVSFLATNFADQVQGETFVLGYLTYFNDTTANNISSFQLQISTNSLDDALFNQTLNIDMTFVSTPNVDGDPESSADFLYFSDPIYSEFGSYRVYEGQSATIEILGSFNSLHLEGFGALTGNGFTAKSLSNISVPEPTSFALFAVALLALLRLRYLW